MSSRPGPAARWRRGSAWLGALILLLTLLGLLYAASRVSGVEVRDTRAALEGVQARYLAEAGVERALDYLAQGSRCGSPGDPLRGLGQLFAKDNKCTPFVAEPLGSGETRVGAYSVTLTATERTPTSITISIESTGYLPDAPQKLAPSQPLSAWSALCTRVSYSLAPSRVFDYGYFLDNGSWFHGNTLVCRGNLRSNGPFDAAGLSPTITGQPLYAAVDWNGSHAALSGCADDNGDGASDGEDGGLWSGWAIRAAQKLQGNGGHPRNQHEHQLRLPMPITSGLALYEASATQQQGSIAVDGAQVCDAVVGDEPGEQPNLYLAGTAAKPIVLNGLVVVRGHVIISGHVTGQGALYVGGNVYCPDSLTYRNPPTAPRPANGSQGATEAWLTANRNKDFLGLFARENIVVGDFTDAGWQHDQESRISDPLNAAAEDAGVDGIPGTRAGRDGLLGTADDDVLEGDGQFTIQRYTQRDANLGLVPDGADLGDGIPGTGEDLDGDGSHDGPATLAALLLTTPLERTLWAGNMPAEGIPSYRSIASMSAANLDAVFLASHSFCWSVNGSQNARINGALVCRNDNIVCGAPLLEINYDCRLLGGHTSRAARFLPLALQFAELQRSSAIDHDPNREIPLP